MASARTVAVAVAIAAMCGAGLWFAASLEVSNEAAAPEPASVAPTSATAAPLELAPTEAARDAVREAPRGAPLASGVPAISSEAPVMPNALTTLRGRLIVIESDGRERFDCAGELELLVRDRQRGERRDVRVEAGAWSLPWDFAAPPAKITVSEITVEGARAALEAPLEGFRPPFDAELVLRARRSRPSVLRVLDAATGADLADVTLWRPTGSAASHARYLSSSAKTAPLVRAVRSPIEVASFAEWLGELPRVDLLVDVDGYAWERVQLDLTRGGERIVSLARGGELEVLARGVEPSAHAVLRLRTQRSSAPCAGHALRAEGVQLFAGLAESEYHVSVEVGEWFDSPLVLAESSATVRAGERARVELVLALAPRAQRVDIAGRVYLAEGWGVEIPDLTLSLLDTPLEGSDSRSYPALHPVASDRAGFSAFAWSSSAVQVGKYELLTYKPPLSIVIEAPPGGRSDFEFVIPPPTELTVRVIDASTGADVVADALYWHPVFPEGVDGGSMEPAQRDAEHGHYVIRAPAVPVALQVSSLDYQPYESVVDLSRGAAQHQIRLERACGVVLALRDGETPIPHPDTWYGDFRAVSGDGQLSLLQSSPFERKCMVTTPGVYEFDVPPISGYKPTPAQRVEVRAGEFTRHVVQLERERP